MTFQFNPMFPDATDEQKWEQIKLWRNAELRNTDWTTLTDAPTNKTAWAEYRQALRDLPEQNVLAEEVVIPEKPAQQTSATTSEPVVEEPVVTEE